MTVKIVLLKSGEDIIADVNEMVIGEGDDAKIVGYFLKRPCVVKLVNQGNFSDSEEVPEKPKYNITMFPWMPISKEEIIPVGADWVVTMVEPVDNIKQMYEEDVLNAVIGGGEPGETDKIADFTE